MYGIHQSFTKNGKKISENTLQPRLFLIADRYEYNVIAIAWGEFAHKECDRKKSREEEYDDPDPSDYF